MGVNKEQEEVERLKKELKDLESQYDSRYVSDADRQIITDKIREIALKIREIDGGVEKRIVPVIGASTVANKQTPRMSRFMNSESFRI